MKDVKNKEITTGDRVKVLWNYDNQYHTGKVVNISGNIITIHAPSNKVHVPGYRISLTDRSRITKINE